MVTLKVHPVPLSAKLARMSYWAHPRQRVSNRLQIAWYGISLMYRYADVSKRANEDAFGDRLGCI